MALRPHPGSSPPAAPDAVAGWAACAGVAVTLSVLLACTTGWLAYLVVSRSGPSGLLGTRDWDKLENAPGGVGLGVAFGVSVCGAFAAGSVCTLVRLSCFRCQQGAHR